MGKYIEMVRIREGGEARAVYCSIDGGRHQQSDRIQDLFRLAMIDTVRFLSQSEALFE